MDKLTEARKIINSVDAEMAKLFCRRMAAVKDVLEYKREHGLPVLDTARENAVMEANSALIDDEALKEYYISFIRATMAVSREYQRSLLSGIRAAYCGVEGAFAQIAAKHIYADCEAKAYPSFAAAYAAVEEGECEVAVLPIENSSAGEVGQVVDLIFAGNLYINGVYELAVEQNLMALPGARLSDIKTVFSHPQALMQCAPFLEEKGMQTKAFENTAAAAKFVSESGDRTVAAIASDETAKLYGLEIIERVSAEFDRGKSRIALNYIEFSSRRVLGTAGNELVYAVCDIVCRRHLLLGADACILRFLAAALVYQHLGSYLLRLQRLLTEIELEIFFHKVSQRLLDESVRYALFRLVFI